MKKRILFLVMLAGLNMTGCHQGKNEDIKDTILETIETFEKETNVLALESGSEYESEMEEDHEIAVGEVWEIDGQWRLEIISVEQTSERNEYADRDPEAVYEIEYVYENKGYQDQTGFMDGLYMDLSMGQIVDAEGTMGYAYPLSHTIWPQSVPIGAKTTAKIAIGVEHPGDFTIIYHEFDGHNRDWQTKFICSENK